MSVLGGVGFVCRCGSENGRFVTCQTQTGRPHEWVLYYECFACGARHVSSEGCLDCRAVAEEHR